MSETKTPITDAVDDWEDPGKLRDCSIALERELAAMTAERDVYKFACKHAYQREQLAERQVAVLIGRLRHCRVCPSSPHFDWRKDCKHGPFPSHEKCVECLAAWSRAEAERGKG